MTDESEPQRIHSAWVLGILETIDQQGNEKYESFLEKAGGSVGQLLKLPKDLHDKDPLFKPVDVEEAINAMIDGKVRILTDPYGSKSKTNNEVFIMMASGKNDKGGNNQLPQLLLVNASMWPNQYSISNDTGFPVIRNI